MYRNLKQNSFKVSICAKFALVLFFTSYISLFAEAQYVIKADGVTDDSDAINDVLLKAAQTGGKVSLPAGKIILLKKPIVLRSRVILEGQGGTVLRWGLNGGHMIRTPINDVIHHCTLKSLEIQAGTAAVVLDIHSAYGCKFEDLVIDSQSETSTILKLTADSTAGGYPTADKRNIANNYFSHIEHLGKCGTFLSLSGTGTARNYPQVVTLNTFNHLFARDCYERGIYFIRFADSNAFTGITRVNVKNQGAVGVEFGEFQGVGVGIYSDTFEHLDVRSSQGINYETGNCDQDWNQKGIRINAGVKQITIKNYFNDPTCRWQERSLVIDDRAISYSIRMMEPGGAIRNFTREEYQQ